MEESQREIGRIRRRLGDEEFDKVISSLENLSAYHDMHNRSDVEFVEGAEPPDIGTVLELIDGLYNPFSTSRGAYSTTEDILLAIQREYNMKRGYELSLRNNGNPSKVKTILKTVENGELPGNSLRFIKRRENGKLRYRHPASSLSISETTFFELKSQLRDDYDLSPKVMDSYLSFVSNDSTEQKQLSSYE